MRVRIYPIFLLLTLCAILIIHYGCEEEKEDFSGDFGVFTDSRDGQIYEWVRIGDQIWMAENLAYLPNVSPAANGSHIQPHYYVYGYQGTSVKNAKEYTDENDINIYEIYGVLYNYPAAESSCPIGWHLPNDLDWTQLTEYLGGFSVAANKLKEADTIHWCSQNTATNESGFTALPGAQRFEAEWGEFYKMGEIASFWSSTLFIGDTSVYHVNNYVRTLYCGGTIWRGPVYKGHGLSVRCIKD